MIEIGRPFTGHRPGVSDGDTPGRRSVDEGQAFVRLGASSVLEWSSSSMVASSNGS